MDLEGVEIGPHRFVWTISNGWDFYMSLSGWMFFFTLITLSTCMTCKFLSKILKNISG